MVALLFDASRTSGVVYGIAAVQFRFLEKKLNQKLFIRSTKKVRLTPEGELLLRHVEPAMNLIHRGEIQLLEASWKSEHPSLVHVRREFL